MQKFNCAYKSQNGLWLVELLDSLTGRILLTMEALTLPEAVEIVTSAWNNTLILTGSPAHEQNYCSAPAH